MATNRKRRTIVEETLEPGEATDAGGTHGVDISDMIVVTTKVYKLNAGSKSFVTQSSEPVDEVFLQNNYPSGGKYVVYEYNTLNQLVNTVNYDIEPKPIASNGNHNGNGMGSIHDMQIRMLLDELNHSRQMTLTLIQQMGNNRGSNLNELVAALSGLHNLTGGNVAGKDPVELLIKGMELGQNGGKVSSDWKSELLSIAKDVAPGVVNAIAASNARQPAALNPAPGVNEPMTMLQPTPEETLKAYLPELKQQIIGGLNTDLAVAWLTQNANNPQYIPLLSLAVQGNIDSFIAIDHQIGNEPFRTWFTNAIAEIKEWYAEQQQVQVDDDLDRGTGNGANVSHDANVSNRSAKLAKTV